MSLRWVLVAVVVAPALACRMGSRQETPPETTHRTESVYAEMEVSALRWSDGDWPFTVDSGILSCEGSRARPYLFFATLDRETIWPLNGRARELAGVLYMGGSDAHQRDITPIRRMVPSREQPGVTIRVPLDPLRERGATLCSAAER